MAALPDLLFGAERRFGRRPALALRRGLRTEVWSYEDLTATARAAAERLSRAGLRPGDRVLTLAPNSPELVASMFGVWLAGGVLVPLDLKTPDDLAAGVRDLTAPRLLISATSCPGLAGLPTFGPSEIGAVRRTTPLSARPQSPVSRPMSDLAEIVFTSGTTAAPKGVMLTHTNILANVASALDAVPIKPGERLLSLLPLSHMLEQTSGLLAALAAGATIYYVNSRRSTALLAAMRRHSIGLLVCVPEVLKLLLAGIERQVEQRGRQQQWKVLQGLAGRLPIFARPWLFASIHRGLGGSFRVALCGGAPLDPQLWRSWERLGVRVIQGYGATECAPIVTSNRLERRLSGSVGWPVRDVTLRLAADGEVLVKGPNVSPGYWRDGEATTAAFLDGCYHSGDLGALGPAGELRLLGRKKEMIVLADGRNVFPSDVEAVLQREREIRDCIVVGRPRPAGGEEVHAVLIPSDSPSGATAAVRRANARLGPHQQVVGTSIWSGPDFPRTPALKVKRAEVLAALDRQVAAEPAARPTNAPADSLEERLFALLARASGRPRALIAPDADLVSDLGLDSLARVELAVLLEEELGVSLSDEEMASQGTAVDLLVALDRGGSASTAEPLAAWPRGALARAARAVLQRSLLFPFLRGVARPRQVYGLERLRELAGPALIIANHTSHLDSLAVLSVLPLALRGRTAVAAAADYFFANRLLGAASELTLNAFPFHREGPVSASLAHCGDLVDAGYSILVFPEGTRSPDGQPRPFKPGIGLLARELGLPVVPIHLDGLHAVLPKGSTWPRPGPVRITIGQPLRLGSGCSNLEAVKVLEASMATLHATRAEPV